MKAFSIIGGIVSPNAVVIAKTWQKAKQAYNDWLELTYGRRDEGVGIHELTENQVCLCGGLMIYTPDVRGFIDPRYNNGSEYPFLGDYKPGDKIRAEVVFDSVAFDEGTAWNVRQKQWLNRNKGKVVNGKVKELNGSSYFVPNRAPLALNDDEIKIYSPPAKHKV